MKEQTGKVYLVGAGPGDSQLLTIRANELLGQAEVLVYDNLVHPEIVDLVPESCEKIYAGKQRGHHELTQEQIGEVLIAKAKEGKRVVRLKGGDPYIFGRGGEEAIALVENQIPFESIPGITSGTAAATYAGIPLINKSLAQPVTILTGHLKSEQDPDSIPWSELVQLGGTLIIYMGVSNLENIIAKLIENKINPNTPAAIIESATISLQKTVIATVETLSTKAKEQQIKSPAIILIGDALKRNSELNWFEQKPLRNKKIVLTRPIEKALSFKKRLIELGAEVSSFPVIKFELINLNQEQQQKILNSSNYDWLIFTSANAVQFFFEQISRFNKDARIIGKAKIAAVGSSTANILKDFGVLPDLQPEKFNAENLVQRMTESEDLKDKRILFPCSDIALSKIESGLEKVGAKVERLAVYKTLPNKPKNLEQLKDQIENDSIDTVVFQSPSAVQNFFQIIHPELISQKNMISLTSGATTTSALKDLNIKRIEQADDPTNEGLVVKLFELHIESDSADS